MDKFKVGDVVRLRSGGRVKTVTSLGKNGEVSVQGFSSHDERGVSSASFPADALKTTEPG